MHFGEIDIPDEVSSALEAGRLVIFVGAGVSRPAPSDLPLFDKLADEIAKGTGLKREQRQSETFENEKALEIEPVDRFLGRVAKEGAKVKEIAQQILVGAHTLPNVLHESLVRLFADPGNLRIVTTNFDQHLSTVLTAAHPDRVDVYRAPALPVGSNFSGLVYLHGSAVDHVQDCVLTDEDFGRAYLTEGWARRFLVSMFESFTVLFVGYSHNDPVMNYLARGLPPHRRNKRFAIVPNGEEAHWHFLDIRPVTYTRREADNPHEALMESLQKWATSCQHGFSEKVKRVCRNAKGPPPKDVEEQDFMVACFKETDLIRHFVDTCEDASWLAWAEGKGLLRSLFKPSAELSGSERSIAWWIAQKLLTKNTPDLLRLIERVGAHDLHPFFCDRIHWVLCNSRLEETTQKAFGLWVAVLLAQPHGRLGDSLWARLLAACQMPDDQHLVVPLFERATALDLKISKQWSFSKVQEDESTPVKLDVDLEQFVHYHLGEAWRKIFTPNLPLLGILVFPIVTHRIIQAHHVLSAFLSSKGLFDPLSFGRRSIEPHAQNQHLDRFQFLVTMARDLIAAFQGCCSGYARSIIQTWIGLDVVLLKRLAIHALARQHDMSPSERVQVCITHDLLFDLPVRTELFFLLQTIYPQLPPENRSTLLEAVERGPSEQQCGKHDDEFPQRQVFKLVGWLAQTDPGCALAHARFSLLQERHPGWSIGEHPDLLSWTRGFRFSAVGAGLNFAEILAEHPSQYISRILAASENDYSERGRHDLCASLSPLIAQNISWGIECQKSMRTLGVSDDVIWQYVSLGWKEAKPSVDEWHEIFKEFLIQDIPLPFFNYIPNTLEAWIKRDADKVPSELHEAMDQIALNAWEVCLSKLPPQNEEVEDWLSLAINRPAGVYAEYWLLRLEMIQKASEDSMGAIPEPVRSVLTSILHNTGEAGEVGTAIIAAQIRWLDAIDREFAKKEVFPLFDWNSDKKRVEQCWDGFLAWGCWSVPVLNELLPHFEETVRRLASTNDEERDRKGEQVAAHLAAVSFWMDNPMKDGWLLSCLQDMAVVNRVEFAIELTNQLKQASAEETEVRWQRWLEAYWKSRLQGVPLLNQQEANHMVSWTLHLGQHVPSGVELAKLLMRQFEFEHFYLIHEIEESSFADLHPIETAELLIAALKTNPRWYQVDEETRAIWKKLVGKVSPGLLHALRDELIRFGGSLEEFSQP